MVLYIRKSFPKHARYRQITAQQVMGNLPKNKITMSYRILNTGIDYVGIYYIRN